MFVSYVLRLRPESVHEGRFVGEVEAVATGHRFAVRSVDQMVAFVRETLWEEIFQADDARPGPEADW